MRPRDRADPDALTPAERRRIRELWLRVPADADEQHPAARELADYLRELGWGEREVHEVAIAYYAVRLGAWRDAERAIQGIPAS